MTYAIPLWPTRDLPLAIRFDVWLRTDNGLAVYFEVRDRALTLYRAGVEHYGVAAIFEAARYDRTRRLGRDDDNYRLNHNYRSHLARRLMSDYPELDGFFETRALTA